MHIFLCVGGVGREPDSDYFRLCSSHMVSVAYSVCGCMCVFLNIKKYKNCSLHCTKIGRGP